MALTAEQQAQLDFQVAANQVNESIEQARRQHEKDMEQLRATNALAVATANTNAVATASAKQARLEAIRMAKETLIENARSKPVDSRDVTAADITAFADTLIAYVNK